MKSQTIESIEKNKIIVIVRGIPKTHILKTAEAMYRGKIKLMEITFDQSNLQSNTETAEMIRMLKDEFKNDICVGAGTVLTDKQLEMAHYAGAEYIISPDTNPNIIKKTVQVGLVSIPGAITPSEIRMSHDWGADFVKIFPISALSDNYIKNVLAPLGHIKLLAVGGVSVDNLVNYLQQGAYGVGIGDNIVNKQLIMSGKFKEVTNLAMKYASLIV